MDKVILSPIDIQNLVNLIAQRTVEMLNNGKQEQPKQATDETDLLTPKETAQLLRISIPTLWRYEKKGKVKCYGIGGKRYYKRNEIIESLTVKK